MATEAAAPYIDTLLKRVAARGATLGIRFESGAPVRVTDGSGGLRDITNRTLSPQEITAAIAPILPDAIKRLPQAPSATINYDCPGVGVFTVAIRRDGEKMSVAIDPAWHARASTDLTATAQKPTEPEFVVETTSVSAVVAANAPAAAKVSEPQVSVVHAAPIAPLAPVAPIAPVAPTASIDCSI